MSASDVAEIRQWRFWQMRRDDQSRRSPGSKQCVEGSGHFHCRLANCHDADVRESAQIAKLRETRTHALRDVQGAQRGLKHFNEPLFHFFTTSELTRFGGTCPFSAAMQFSAAITAIRVRVVTEALAMCGASTTLGNSINCG